MFEFATLSTSSHGNTARFVNNLHVLDSDSKDLKKSTPNSTKPLKPKVPSSSTSASMHKCRCRHWNYFFLAFMCVLTVYSCSYLSLLFTSLEALILCLIRFICFSRWMCWQFPSPPPPNVVLWLALSMSQQTSWWRVAELQSENIGSAWKLGIPTWFWAIARRGRWRQWSLPNSEGVRLGGTYKSMGYSMLHHTKIYQIFRILAVDYLHWQCLPNMSTCRNQFEKVDGYKSAQELPWTSWTGEQQGLHGESMSILKLLGTNLFDKCDQATIRPRQQKPNPGAKRRHIHNSQYNISSPIKAVIHFPRFATVNTIMISPVPSSSSLSVSIIDSDVECDSQEAIWSNLISLVLLKHLIYHHVCIFICSLHLFVLIVLYPLYSGSMLYNRLAIPFPLDLPGHPRLRLWQWTNLSAETRLSHFASEPRLTQILRSYAVMSRMYARVYVKILQSVSIHIYNYRILSMFF